MKAKGIFIHLNTPSSKNSKTMVIKQRTPEEIRLGKKGKRLLLNSKTVMKYKKDSKLDWLEQKAPFRHLSRGVSLPLVIGVHFIRGTRHKYDWINMVQIVQDLMKEYGWIEDDNVENLIPIPFKMNGQYSTYNKERPGVWIVPITEEILTELNQNLNE